MDLIWNGQRLLVPGGGLHIGWPGSTPTPDKIDMITSSDGVNFSSLPVVTGVQTIKMNLFVPNTSSFFRLIFSDGATQDYFRVDYGTGESGPALMFEIRNSPTTVRQQFDLGAASLLNIPFQVEVVKGTASITSIKFNGNTLTPLAAFLAFGPSNQHMFVGSNHTSVWNLEIVGTHKWIGFPYGNTSGAWIDTIGSINGTITGTPGTQTL